MYLQDESTEFYKVSGLFIKKFGHDQNIKADLIRFREQYQGKRFQSQMVLSLNDVIINSEETVKNWLNAHEYHRDQDKQKELEELSKLLPLDAMKPIFLSLLTDKAYAICGLARLINCVIDADGRRLISGEKAKSTEPVE
ncbi:hypothetical protein WDW89_12150 [Deltaproteobacteria bacterium TL4]